MLKPSPQRRWYQEVGHWEVIISEGGALVNGEWGERSYKRPHTAPSPLCSARVQDICELGEAPTGSGRHLDLGPSAPGTVRKVGLFFLSHPGHGAPLEQPERTECLP